MPFQSVTIVQLAFPPPATKRILMTEEGYHVTTCTTIARSVAAKAVLCHLEGAEKDFYFPIASLCLQSESAFSSTHRSSYQKKHISSCIDEAILTCRGPIRPGAARPLLAEWKVPHSRLTRRAPLSIPAHSSRYLHTSTPIHPPQPIYIPQNEL